MDKKIKILALCDSPTSSTGFAQVSKNILNRLAKTGKYEIDVIGINYNGDYYDRETYKYNIYPAMRAGDRDMYGRDRLLSALMGNQAKEGLTLPWDIVFTIQDPFIIEGLGLSYKFAEQLRVTSEMWKRVIPPELWFKWIGYFPVDSEVKENWVNSSIAMCDYPVAYCEWGVSRILKYDKEEFEVNFNLELRENQEKKKARFLISGLKDRLQYIHHGVDLNTFKVISDEEKKEFREKFFNKQVKEDTFLVVNISRNQPRKDIPRTMAAFAEFKKIVPNSYLYLHMQSKDVGGNIDEYARQFGLIPGKDYALPLDFDAGNGYTVDVVNKIYNIADLCITTTLGEGWGFITSESMATKTPIIAPNITSILDIFNTYNTNLDVDKFWKDNNIRGIPVKAGVGNSDWIALGASDNERIRPLTDIDDLVKKMVWAFNNKDKVNEIVERAYAWIQTQTWELVVDQWESIFEKAYNDLKAERELAQKIDTAGRNDLCPCGSGKKFKHCHLSQKRPTKMTQETEMKLFTEFLK